MGGVWAEHVAAQDAPADLLAELQRRVTEACELAETRAEVIRARHALTVTEDAAA